ncbi:glycosyltransferase involved in cell wall biosynthesis [Inhella inkyongensis]|uniref:Glycosyltransferase involved in cell wall biosynthesis n=1 Tax=Inhella inkyongensis TaxID=392593 RepID=A0A840RVV1_9BURK|nr:glycosyltransferase [Inhella inkyongensis]MBB5202787.1 glycosyltransferase involved in cell wall biosynthesis [Inhella inkyongensis]
MARAISNNTINSRQLLSVGRLIGHKNTDILIKAMHLLPDYHLTVVGEGPELSRLKALSPSNVQFTGWISDQELTEVRARSAAFLFAAVEDFGIAPIEALAAGMPVIAYAEGGVLDYLNHQENAWLYETLCPESVAAAVRGMSAEAGPELSARCVASANIFTEELFDKRFSEWVQRHWLEWNQTRRTNFRNNLGKAKMVSIG